MKSLMINNKNYREEHLEYFKTYREKWRKDNPDYHKTYYKDNKDKWKRRRLKELLACF